MDMQSRAILLGVLIGLSLFAVAWLIASKGIVSRESADPKYFMRFRRFAEQYPMLWRHMRAADPQIADTRVDSNTFKVALQRVRTSHGMGIMRPDVPTFAYMRQTEDRLKGFKSPGLPVVNYLASSHTEAH